MLSQAVDAAEAGYLVGYESPSQFSREYRRLFGAPPVRDIATLKSSEEGSLHAIAAGAATAFH
jgi:AraC-like DNA-binding protein